MTQLADTPLPAAPPSSSPPSFWEHRPTTLKPRKNALLQLQRSDIIRPAVRTICTREDAGEELAIVLLHGFPDNQYLYDRARAAAPRR